MDYKECTDMIMEIDIDGLQNYIRERTKRFISIESSAIKIKKVKQINPITNKVIKVYKSLVAAAKDFGHVSQGRISDCTKNGELCYGYKWELC